MNKSLLLVFLFFQFTEMVSAQAPDFEWAKQQHGIFEERCNAITTDSKGNVYTTGYFRGTVDFDTGPGVFNLTSTSMWEDIYVTKLDSSGNFKWAKHFAGTGADGGKGFAIAVDTFGNVYTTGKFDNTVDFDPGAAVFNLTASGHSDIFISKLDSSGNFKWADQFKGVGPTGSTGCAIKTDKAGNVFMTGGFSGTVDFDPGPGTNNLTSAGGGDICVVKLNSAGDLIWVKEMGSAGDDSGLGIDLNNVGNILVQGQFQGTVDFDPGAGIYNVTSITANGDQFICKLDAAGNLSWVKNFPVFDCKSICIDKQNNIIFSGGFAGTVDFDPGPATFNLTATNGGMFLEKLTGSGNFIWADGFVGSTINNYVQSIAVDTLENIYMTGGFYGSVDFDPGPGSLNLSSLVNLNPFFLKLNSSGSLTWGMKVWCEYAAMAYGICLDSAKNIYVGGEFKSPIHFNQFSSNPITLTGANEDIFIAKIKQCVNFTTSSITISACNSYTLNGQTYTTSGVYTQTLPNAAGCDSIITLHLTIGGSNTTSAITACDIYVWNGQTYTISGLYRDTLTGADGCDSIINLNLTINHPVTSNVNASICEGQSYSGHTSSGTFVDVFTGNNGCDSTRTLNLIVKPRSFSLITATICGGQNMFGHTSTGIFKDTLVGANGCDSIRTLDLTVNPAKFTNTSIAICSGQTYFAGGALQTTAGIYRDTLSTSLGCDSVITTNLTVLQSPRPDLGPDRKICANSQASLFPGSFNSYLWQDNSSNPNFLIISPGQFWVKVTATNGCSGADTVNILGLDTIPNKFLPVDQKLCYGSQIKLLIPGYQQYLWSTGSASNSISIVRTGKYYLDVIDYHGCKGSDTLNVERSDCEFILIPNAFSPGGHNPVFRPAIFQTIRDYRMQIFNRYGEEIFITSDYTAGWNGTYKGQVQPQGSYVYRIVYTNILNERSENNGSVILIR